MKQLLQNLSTGATQIVESPTPSSHPGTLLIATTRSLISIGTEKMLIDFGKGNLLQKAQQQPDKVKQALEKIRTDGLAPTVDAIRNKLDAPMPLGYCNVGRIIETGAGVTNFDLGDRIASNGPHASVVSVPQNLCASIPDNVEDESATFTVMGAIALQGIRLLNPHLGETMVVTGLGLIGLLAVQILKANGCRVLGIDLDPTKLALAKQFGAETVDLSQHQDPIAAAAEYSLQRGVDGVLITASTKSSEPVHQAATMCRKRGRIVLIGVVGLELSRADFYEKELSFQVSCSYGPGRYDAQYEIHGYDYPIGFVRWTEQRNFEAVLDLMSNGQLNVAPLISHRFALDDAAQAYELLSQSSSLAHPLAHPLGVVLEYPDVSAAEHLVRTVSLPPAGSVAAPTPGPTLGFIGAGSYATSTLIPAFVETGIRLKSVASAGGVSSVHAGSKFGIEQATTDSSAMLADAQLTALVVSTRHNSHAQWVLDGLQAGKHMFVEKPLALNYAQLGDIETAYAHGEQILMVGFNRRYAPLTRTIKNLIEAAAQPLSMIMTVNAGVIPADHWVHDPVVGGGRIIGEACHFHRLAAISGSLTHR